MANIFQGVAAPDVNTTKTLGTEAPKYYQDYLSGLAGAGTQALAKTPEQIVAPMTEMQKAGLAAVPGAATAYQPGLTAATTTAADVAGGLTPERIQALMSPYTKNVTDEMARLSQQNLQRNLLPALKSAFTATGGLGGQRMAGAMGQMGADIQANLTGAQTGALQKGYSDALTAALQNLQIQNQAATTEGALAGKAQELGLTGANALTTAGAQEQAQQQALLNAPLTQATNVASLMKGYSVPVTTTEKYTGPMAGVYGTSPLAQITGLGTILGSGLSDTTSTVYNPATGKYETKTTPGWLSSGLSSLGSGLKSAWNLATQPNTEGATEITNTATPGSEGYGWKYYSDGTSIDPQGNYYQGGQKIWSPGGDISGGTSISSEVPSDYVAPNVEE